MNFLLLNILHEIDQEVMSLTDTIFDVINQFAIKHSIPKPKFQPCDIHIFIQQQDRVQFVYQRTLFFFSRNQLNSFQKIFKNKIAYHIYKL